MVPSRRKADGDDDGGANSNPRLEAGCYPPDVPGHHNPVSIL